MKGQMGDIKMEILMKGVLLGIQSAQHDLEKTANVMVVWYKVQCWGWGWFMVRCDIMWSLHIRGKVRVRLGLG